MVSAPAYRIEPIKTGWTGIVRRRDNKRLAAFVSRQAALSFLAYLNQHHPTGDWG